MKAKWLGKTGFCTQVGKYLENGAEYTGSDRVVADHIKNGLAVEVKVPKKSAKQEDE